jgi:RIO kinase 1
MSVIVASKPSSGKDQARIDLLQSMFSSPAVGVEDEGEDDEYWDEEEEVDGDGSRAAGGGGGPFAHARAPTTAGHEAGGGTGAAAVARELERPERAALAQSTDRMLSDRYADRVNTSMLESKATAASRHTGRDDRATVENVLDPRTRLVLFKMLSTGFITEINGCISTGKEANVYHARRPDGGSYAIKIYKTSILVFKDRDRYVSGEYRFRSGYSRGNPRKMVKLWAEKEMRNLKRLHTAGLPTPCPHLLRMHILVMDFLGEEGWPSPRLKDAGLSVGKMGEAYMDVVDLMRTMFQTCRLVHADLSEYNLLWHEGRVHVIDVSQSVETDHPRALEFLRMDAANISLYFRRGGVPTMSARELFDYVVHASLPDKEAEQAYLDAARSRADARVASGEEEEEEGGEGEGKEGRAQVAAEAQVAEAVFMQAYIPGSLAGVRDIEADTAAVARGEGGNLYYAALTGIDGAARAGAEAEAEEGSGEEGEEGEESGEEGSAEPAFTRAGADKDARKAHKAEVKAAAREKRKTKLKKHLKKRATQA